MGRPRHPKTHYEVLGIGSAATHHEVKRAYHRLARRHHPDTHGPASAAVLDSARRKMVEINTAWAVLGDPERRRDYDVGLGHRRYRPDPENPDANAGTGRRGPDPQVGYPDWFEPDDQVPAADLEEDLDRSGHRGPADFVVFVPVGIAALAVAAFAFSLVVQWPALFVFSVVLVPLAVVSFLLTPLVVIATRVRSRP